MEMEWVEGYTKYCSVSTVPLPPGPLNPPLIGSNLF